MKQSLPLDVSRCLGWGCDDKHRCQRHKTLALDDIHSYSTRSYVSSLRLPDEKTCPCILEDKE